MIVKGNVRANGRQLAAYLLAQGDNEQKPELVEQLAYDGMDLDFALRALEVEAIGTRCRLPLYHAQIVPAQGEHLTREQFAEAVSVLERELGLVGQPRVVVSHIKNGTEHQHVVWGRIDQRSEKAIDFKFNWRSQEKVARILEKRFNLRQVQGKHFDVDGNPLSADQKRSLRQKEKLARNHAEQCQERRGSKPKQERMAEIRAIWQATTTGRELRDRLADAGYTLAQGDRRAFVVVDRAGEAHSLARQAGVTVKEIKARLSDVSLTNIPTVSEVREAMRRTAKERSPLTPDTPTQERGERERQHIDPAVTPPPQEQRPPSPSPEHAHPLDGTAALEELTRQHSTFTHGNLTRFARENTETTAQAEALVDAVEEHPDLVHLGLDRTGRERFTSRDMLETELRMEAAAGDLADARSHRVHPRIQDAVPNLDKLSAEQARAYRHVLAPEGLSLVEGHAGTGKSYMLGSARKAWVAAGYRVHGAALSGIAAEGLQQGSQIESRTLHSLLGRLDNGKLELNRRDVIVLDEAGMVGSRQMERLLSHAQAAGAKVVLVGDAEQLQAIDAGGAFRALRERHGAASLTEIRRQMPQWQGVATGELATERTAEALERYRAHEMVHETGSRDQAKDDMVRQWAADRVEHPGEKQIMLAYLRADVRELNERARETYRVEGRLGEDHTFTLTDRDGAAHRTKLATGDRVYCLMNDTRLGVRNGTLGTVEGIDGKRLALKLDDGRRMQIDTRAYSQISHGYACTVHKAQGVTADRSYVLASRYLDRHATYVGMSRHRQRADLFWSREEFKTFDRLTHTVSRDRRKDTTLDYLQRAESGEQRPRESLRAAAAAAWQKIKGAFRFQPETVRPPRVEPHFSREEVRREQTFTRTPNQRTAPPRVDPAFAKETVRRRETQKTAQQAEQMRTENARQEQNRREQRQDR